MSLLLWDRIDMRKMGSGKFRHGIAGAGKHVIVNRHEERPNNLPIVTTDLKRLEHQKIVIGLSV